MSNDTIRLGVEFNVDRDRITHRLVLQGDDAPLLIVKSFEGHHSVDWPPSPVMQQVDACQVADGTESLVAVGMAGVSHWSLAVEADRANMAISFDVACRLKSPAEFLGSTYELDGVIDRLDDPVVRLRARQAAGADAEAAVEVMMGRIEINAAGQLVVRPESISDRLPATVRWKYRFLIRA